MKTCSNCKCEKDTQEFYKNPHTKDGFNTFCKECHKATGRVYKRNKWQDPNFHAAELLRKRAYRDRNRAAHSQYMKQWHTKNEDAQREYRLQNADRMRDAYQQYVQLNRHKILARTRMYQSAKQNRTPQWLDDVDKFEMECIYEYCGALRKVGLDYQVDHEIPLRGDLVSGLHTPNNLRVIPTSINRMKSNKFEVC